MSITEIGTELVRIAESFTKVLAELTSIAEGISKLTAEFNSLNESKPEHSKTIKVESTVKYPELTDVRALLAEKSRAGHTTEVHALLENRGFKKLSEVPQTEYAALMDEARAIV